MPLFVSHRQLGGRRSLPRARASWALDSGGFSELSLFGEWRTPPDEYGRAVRRYEAEIGHLDWCAPQDWMCEPAMLAKTGLSVREHQKRTIYSVLELRDMGLPVIPVLQGWEASDYERHVVDYEQAGVDLLQEPVVGLGTVCRRQGTREIEDLVLRLRPLKLHGFGVKATGLRFYGYLLASSDSMAWSYRARRSAPTPGHSHKSCANCLDYALAWRRRLLRPLPTQMHL